MRPESSGNWTLQLSAQVQPSNWTLQVSAREYLAMYKVLHALKHWLSAPDSSSLSWNPLATGHSRDQYKSSWTMSIGSEDMLLIIRTRLLQALDTPVIRTKYPSRETRHIRHLDIPVIRTRFPRHRTLSLATTHIIHHSLIMPVSHRTRQSQCS